MDSIIVSVVIPTYCPREYLWVCLDSLGRQSFERDKYEIVLVLNGCKEPYESMILEYIKQHQSLRIVYIQTYEGGVSNARNIGLEKARGEYIAFIDDDDFVSSCYLEELYHNSDRSTIGLAYPFAFKDGNDSVQLNNRITEEYEANLQKGRVPFYKARKFFSGPCMKMIHRDIIGARRFDRRFKNGEDTLFMFQISDRVEYVSFTTRNAVYYRRFRSNSATTSKRNRLAKIRDNVVGISTYVSIYLKSVKSYKFGFFLTRILGAIRGMVA